MLAKRKKKRERVKRWYNALWNGTLATTAVHAVTSSGAAQHGAFRLLVLLCCLRVGVAMAGLAWAFLRY